MDGAPKFRLPSTPEADFVDGGAGGKVVLSYQFGKTGKNRIIEKEKYESYCPVLVFLPSSPLDFCESGDCMDDSCDAFVLYKQYPDGGSVWLMLGLEDTGTDYGDILAIATLLAERGHEVKVLHAVHYKDPLYHAVFGELIGTRYFRKCPDLLVDGDFVEYESYTTAPPKKAFRNMLHNGLSQSEMIILRHCNLTDGYMFQQIRGQHQNGVPVTRVWIFDGIDLRLIYNTEG